MKCHSAVPPASFHDCQLGGETVYAWTKDPMIPSSCSSLKGKRKQLKHVYLVSISVEYILCDGGWLFMPLPTTVDWVGQDVTA